MATAREPACVVPGRQYGGDYVPPQPLLSETMCLLGRYTRRANGPRTGLQFEWHGGRAISQAAFDMVHCARALARRALVQEACRVRLSSCSHCGAELCDGEDVRKHLAGDGISMLATFDEPEAHRSREGKALAR